MRRSAGATECRHARARRAGWRKLRALSYMHHAKRGGELECGAQCGRRLTSSIHRPRGRQFASVRRMVVGAGPATQESRNRGMDLHHE